MFIECSAWLQPGCLWVNPKGPVPGAFRVWGAPGTSDETRPSSPLPQTRASMEVHFLRAHKGSFADPRFRTPIPKLAFSFLYCRKGGVGGWENVYTWGFSNFWSAPDQLCITDSGNCKCNKFPGDGCWSRWSGTALWASVCGNGRVGYDPSCQTLRRTLLGNLPGRPYSPLTCCLQASVSFILLGLFK